MAVMTNEQPTSPEQLPIDNYSSHLKETSSFSSDKSSYSDSRPSTPEPHLYGVHWDEKPGSGYSSDNDTRGEGAFVGVGLLPEEVYDRTMGKWRAAIRRRVHANIEWESNVLAAMQRRIRRPWLDKYFVYTSSLGTHTFFMITLPAFVFFGYGDVAKGHPYGIHCNPQSLLMVLALGVYASSFIKDAVCSPRPFAPPVTRLTIGSHHLEYGFPSTHSTNSVSIALLFFSLLRQLYTTPATLEALPALFPASQNATLVVLEDVAQEMLMSTRTYWTLTGMLIFYSFSIVYGRLYTGMHSFTDCFVGVMLGTGIWALNLVCSGWLHAWIKDSGWIVPAVTIPLCLLMVHRHPQPVDDCPCFEDAIAFISVVMGEILSRWYMLHNGYDETYFVKVQPGDPWGNWYDSMTWWSLTVVKLVLGILIIFMWRIFAKTVMHTVLPPIFRLLSLAFTLPRRRFYTPATDYKNVPPEKGLHPIPSVIDLPSMMEMEMDVGGASGNSLSAGGLKSGGIYGERNVKLRGARRNYKGMDAPSETDKTGLSPELEDYGGKEDDVVKHYDADVLTKVVVYSGIGMLACGIIPVMFEVLGWGLRVS